MCVHLNQKSAHLIYEQKVETVPQGMAQPPALCVGAAHAPCVQRLQTGHKLRAALQYAGAVGQRRYGGVYGAPLHDVRRSSGWSDRVMSLPGRIKHRAQRQQEETLSGTGTACDIEVAAARRHKVYDCLL